jgi:hypothetical protein
MPEIGNAAQSKSCPSDARRRFLVALSLPWIIQLAAAFCQVFSLRQAAALQEHWRLTDLFSLRKRHSSTKSTVSLSDAGRSCTATGSLAIASVPVVRVPFRVIHFFIHFRNSFIETAGRINSSDKSFGHVDANLHSCKSIDEKGFHETLCARVSHWEDHHYACAAAAAIGVPLECQRLSTISDFSGQFFLFERHFRGCVYERSHPRC